MAAQSYTWDEMGALTRVALALPRLRILSTAESLLEDLAEVGGHLDPEERAHLESGLAKLRREPRPLRAAFLAGAVYWHGPEGGPCVPKSAQPMK